MIWASSESTPFCKTTPNRSFSVCLNMKPVIGHSGMSRNSTCVITEMEDGSKKEYNTHEDFQRWFPLLFLCFTEENLDSFNSIGIRCWMHGLIRCFPS